MVMKMVMSLFTKRVVTAYFVMMCLLSIWILIYFVCWCPPPLPSQQMKQVFPHAGSNIDHDLRNKDRQLKEREQKLEEKERFLKQMETMLMMKFPESAHELHNFQADNIPTIYAITPTYTRAVQKAELTRLAQTFLHVRNFHWIIVEDSNEKTTLVTNFLAKSGLTYTHLNKMTPADYKLADKDPNWLKPRGVLQRNLALKWIRDNLDPDLHKGVVYFADDDNTYDLELFEEMRYTSTVSVWPVGLVGHLRYERPVCDNNKVTGFFTYWKPERPFPLDMAGFAVSVQRLFERPEAKFALRVKRGYQESELLAGLVTRDELEPQAEECKKVLVWHTRTEKADLRNEEKLKARGLQGSDLNIEV